MAWVQRIQSLTGVFDVDRGSSEWYQSALTNSLNDWSPTIKTSSSREALPTHSALTGILARTFCHGVKSIVQAVTSKVLATKSHGPDYRNTHVVKH